MKFLKTLVIISFIALGAGTLTTSFSVDIPIKSAIVSRDGFYSGAFMITPSERPQIVRCYTVRE